MPRTKIGFLVFLIVIVSGCGAQDEEPPPGFNERPPTAEQPPLPQNPNRFDHRYNNREPRHWWTESEPYSCEPKENPDSPWLEAGLIDIGGSDPLSLVRYFGNGSYLQYEDMTRFGCTVLHRYRDTGDAFTSDQPVDPTYYSLGDLDIYVDISRVPRNASGWSQDDGSRVNFSMERAVGLLNQYVASYYRRISQNKLRITFREGIEFTVEGNGSFDASRVQQLTKLGICVNKGDCGNLYNLPIGINRILLNDVGNYTGGFAPSGWTSLGLASFRDASMETIVHEIGHGWMGWPHSYTEIPWTIEEGNYPNPYSNYYDMMSRLNIDFTRGWDVNMPSTAAINRYSAGWIRPEDVALHLEDTGTYTLSRPFGSGDQFLVIHSGRRYAFTTLEVLEERSSRYKRTNAEIYDPSAPGGKRPRRYEGVLVSRYDQSAGTGVNARFGPALYNRSNPNRLVDVGDGNDDYSVIQHGETREIGSGVSVSVRRNPDGSYEVTVRGGKVAEFPKWCTTIGGASNPERGDDAYDEGCLLNESLSNF